MRKAISSLCRFLCVSFLAVQVSSAQAEDVFRIKVGVDPSRYTMEELRQHVGELERAVYQLQMRVFQLETKPAQPSTEWTCRLQTFSGTYIGTGNTKAGALADVLKKCGDASHSIYCKESKTKCDSK